MKIIVTSEMLKFMAAIDPGIEDNPCIEVCDEIPDFSSEPIRYSPGHTLEEIHTLSRSIGEAAKIKPHKTYQKFNRRERWQR